MLLCLMTSTFAVQVVQKTQETITQEPSGLAKIIATIFVAENKMVLGATDTKIRICYGSVEFY